MILRIIFTIIIIIINQGTGLGDCTDEESTRYIEQVKLLHLLVITSISYYQLFLVITPISYLSVIISYYAY